jgi:hypothetical protein
MKRAFAAAICVSFLIGGFVLIDSIHGGKPSSSSKRVVLITASVPSGSVRTIVSTKSPGFTPTFAATITASHLRESTSLSKTLHFGSEVPFEPHVRRICENVSQEIDQWSVWCDGAAQYPVVSVDRGSQWVIAGPVLANDWAGGGIYYTTHVTACDAHIVAITASGVTDTSFDGGRTWYQFGSAFSLTGFWTMTVIGCAGSTRGTGTGVELRVVSNVAGAPRESGWATYVTTNGQTWRRVSQQVD